MAPTKSGLGKGLSALISDTTLQSVNQGYIPALPIDLVKPNPYQPRTEFNPEKLVELADTIREHGVVQPLIVTKKSDTNYELIAGERRLKASKLAGLETVPVVVKEVSPQQMLELAVIENIQRADLNALEEALAFDQLVKLYGSTHDDIAKKVGLSRPAVANKIRLLTLPEEIKRGLLEDKISEGHARSLLGLANRETMIATYKIILRDSLSVRATEELVRRLSTGHKRESRVNERIVDEKTQSYENVLKQKFGERVSLNRSNKGGKITINFKDDSELEKILQVL
jgi:ParB family chromosome partitioning protein